MFLDSTPPCKQIRGSRGFGVACAASLLISLILTGCAAPPVVPKATAAPAVQSLQQYMQEASQASTEGRKEAARDAYRAAAKNYPTSKEPWLKLAEDYFEGANYGQAILAAQEVVQRDPKDSLATSVLAVSGLRVSASALSTLRQQQTALNGGTRTEAEGLARILRDVLGEPVLVPRPGTTPQTAGAQPFTASPAPAAAAKPRPKPATGSAAAAAEPAAKKAETPANPFSVLKN